ncbi:MAG: DUF711 family protein [Syntrophotaleaceae bacterium]
MFNKISAADYCCAEKLVRTTEEIQNLYGIPVINKHLGNSWPRHRCGKLPDRRLHLSSADLDRVAQETGIDFVGGFGALVRRHDRRRPAAYRFDSAGFGQYAKGLLFGERGDRKAGINADAVALMGRIIRPPS